MDKKNEPSPDARFWDGELTLGELAKLREKQDRKVRLIDPATTVLRRPVLASTEVEAL